MLNLTDVLELKKTMGLGKFENYSWEDLCKLVNPTQFYSLVRTPEELRSFMQALSFNFCLNNGCTPMPLMFLSDPNIDVAYTTRKNLSGGKSKIVVNQNYSTMLSQMAHEKNTYFPYFLFEITLHESIHVWQIQALYNMLMLNKMPSDMQIAVLDQKLNELKVQALANGQIKATGANDLVSSTFMIEKVLHNAAKRSENPLWDYSNSPSEIVARDHACQELNKIVKQFAQPQFLGVLSEYVKDSNHQSFALLTDKQFNNYNFFEELKYCQLFEDVHEVKAPYELLSTIVDGSLKRQNLTTYSDYLRKTDEEILVREIEKLGGLVGMILGPEKYIAQVKKLTNDFDADCISALAEMQKSYTALFPYTHTLVQGYNKPNMFMLSDQGRFDLIASHLKALQQTKK